jgi:hypothetical protein
MSNKFHAEKIVIDDIKFDSKRESEYYLLFKSMLQHKQLIKLELQPKFTLQPGFVNKAGKRVKPITYKADFLLTFPGGRQKVVEVKGVRTRDYQLRRKMFEYKFRQYDFEEVH